MVTDAIVVRTKSAITATRGSLPAGRLNQKRIFCASCAAVNLNNCRRKTTRLRPRRSSKIHIPNPNYSIVQGKADALRGSRGEPGGAKAQKRCVSMSFMVTARRSHFFQASAPENPLAGRTQAQVHCLRSGGLAPRSAIRHE